MSSEILNSRKLGIGDKLWFIEDVDKALGKLCMRKWMYREPVKVPYEAKISQVVETKRGISYQLGSWGHIPESFIGVICFLSREEALEKLKSYRLE